MKQYIPFTQARRNRMFALGLQKQLGAHEVLLQVEWPDGSETFKAASWDSEISAWVTDDGKRWYSKGKGGDARTLLGVPVVHVTGENAGVVSQTAAKAAMREEHNEFVDEDGNDLDVTQTNDEGEPVRVKENGDGADEVAADGGEVDLHYDMSPPDDAEGNTTVGEVIDRSLAGLYDPFPVSRRDADQAVENAINAGKDSREDIKKVLIGVGIGLGIPTFLFVLVWLLGQLGGDGGGGAAIALTVLGGAI
jgi:hypothetical protein